MRLAIVTPAFALLLGACATTAEEPPVRELPGECDASGVQDHVGHRASAEDEYRHIERQDEDRNQHSAAAQAQSQCRTDRFEGRNIVALGFLTDTAVYRGLFGDNSNALEFQKPGISPP